MKLSGIVGIVLFLIVTGFCLHAFESIDANEILVKQDPFSGERDVIVQPGMKYIGLSKTTTYLKRGEYVFDVVDSEDRGKKIQFNDGGHGTLYGKVQWEMPLDKDSILKLDSAYHSQEAIAQKVVGQTLDTAIYLSGPLMSSTESAAERRGELINVIDDQAASGIYATKVVEKTITDPLTNVQKTQITTEIIKDVNGLPKRQQGSMIAQYGIHLMPANIRALEYEDKVQRQISARQDAITSVQTAIANARKAEQDVITVKAQGEADAAREKWKQEAINAKDIALAQKELTVKELEAKKAAQYKLEQTLIGEGNAAKMAAEMQANGALDQKLEAWVKAQEYWANAFANSKNPLVPVYTSGNSGGSNNSVDQMQQIMNMVGINQAKQLGLDLSISKK